MTVDDYKQLSLEIEGWFRGDEIDEMIRELQRLPMNCVVVEIGAFLGSASVLMGGVLNVCGSGKLYCVDPFDGSGDEFSIPVYDGISKALGRSLRQTFDDNIEKAGLNDRVEAIQGLAQDVAQTWRRPIDLLFLDGDQSPAGARSTYDAWAPFLKPEGVIAIHNTADREYAEAHSGSRQVALAELRPPRYRNVRLLRGTHFATKCDLDARN